MPIHTKPDIHRLLEFQKLLVGFSASGRMVYIPPDAKVAESNVQHTFSLVMLAWFLAPYFPRLDANKLMYLGLAHDMVEMYCGDTFSFDEKAVQGQSDREAASLARLKKDWADFPALFDAIHEYEKHETAEAKFVTALDGLHPVLMDYLCEGRSWQKLGITLDKLLAVKDKKIAISPDIFEYYDQLKGLLVDNPQLFSKARVD